MPLAFLHQYTYIVNIVAHETLHAGFEVTSKACCGTGEIELGFLCNKLTPFTCVDADKYLFFDSVHLSQRAYKTIANIFFKFERSYYYFKF